MKTKGGILCMALLGTLEFLDWSYIMVGRDSLEREGRVLPHPWGGLDPPASSSSLPFHGINKFYIVPRDQRGKGYLLQGGGRGQTPELFSC